MPTAAPERALAIASATQVARQTGVVMNRPVENTGRFALQVSHRVSRFARMALHGRPRIPPDAV